MSMTRLAAIQPPATCPPFQRRFPLVGPTGLGLLVAGVLALVGPLLGPAAARACPFCSTPNLTFTEELNSMDAVVLARLVEPPRPPSATSSEGEEDIAKAKFQIVEVLKGKEHLGQQTIIETIFFGEGQKGRMFLVMGVDPPKVMWSTPQLVSEKAQKYVKRLFTVAAAGPARLKFFQDYLEDKEELLARDAYDEFAKAPYSAVKELKADMRHDELVAWITDPEVPTTRRRLYLTMLGVCGSEADLPLLERLMRSEDRRDRGGLDAMIACYLTLKGEAGMPLIEELFLKNPKVDFADTYAAIMAIRFHLGEDVVPKERLLMGLRHVLDRPQMEDLVIPDLAQYGDWSQMERLVRLFKESDAKSSWVRVPVINYLLKCPKPEAKKYIEELEKIDPASVKRARTFFPVDGEKSSSTSSTDSAGRIAATGSGGGSSPAATGVPLLVRKVAERTLMVPVATESPDWAEPVPQVAEILPVLPESPLEAVGRPNLAVLLSVLWGSAALLLIALWSILRGAGRQPYGLHH